MTDLTRETAKRKTENANRPRPVNRPLFSMQPRKKRMQPPRAAH